MRSLELWSGLARDQGRGRGVLRQTFEYDWLGNNEKTTDDANGFYDRSLGVVESDAANDKPYQLKSASLPGARGGELEAKYDAAGHMTRFDLGRDGPCLPEGATCSQRFAYEWDEVGRLVRARRWDTSPGMSIDDPLPGGTPAADLRYAYDAGDQRVVKEAVDELGEKSYTLYVFETLELRRAQYDEDFGEGTNVTDYEASVWTVVPYLLANGVRIARLVYEGSEAVPEEDPSSGGGLGEVHSSTSQLHVFFELGDHLGSTAVVLDKATGELVEERSTFQGYGGAESDYRPGRWKNFREDYRFTGKEEDVEVGLQYFGKRYLNPLLGRWISADPLAVHAPGEADLNLYAYVSGQVLMNVDPLGLEEVQAQNTGGASSFSDQRGGEQGQGNSPTDYEYIDGARRGLADAATDSEYGQKVEIAELNYRINLSQADKEKNQDDAENLRSEARKQYEYALAEADKFLRDNHEGRPGSAEGQRGYEQGYSSRETLDTTIAIASVVVGGKGRVGVKASAKGSPPSVSERNAPIRNVSVYHKTVKESKDASRHAHHSKPRPQPKKTDVEKMKQWKEAQKYKEKERHSESKKHPETHRHDSNKSVRMKRHKINVHHKDPRD